MRVLVTGRSGQVATCLAERAAVHGYHTVLVGRPEFDLTDACTISAAFDRWKPDIVVSAAAYTAVDRAEHEQELAFLVNSIGPAFIAAEAEARSLPIIHISTDYVFDGELQRAYVETDPTGPTTVYGQSKLGGEAAVCTHSTNCAVLRTAWVFSPFGRNFVNTMLQLGKQRSEVSVVQDQFGNPTGAHAIADGILAVAKNLLTDSRPQLRGIFHMVCSGSATWCEFAEAIFQLSAQRGGPAAKVVGIMSDAYPTPARRPANSRLDSTLIRQIHGVKLPTWQVALEDLMRRRFEHDATFEG